MNAFVSACEREMAGFMNSWKDGVPPSVPDRVTMIKAKRSLDVRPVLPLTSILEKENIMSSSPLGHDHLELLPNDLFRPLGAFEELFCLFDQQFPTNGALAAQIPATRPSSSGVSRLMRYSNVTRCSLPALTQFNRVPHFRRVIGPHVPLRVVISPLPGGSGRSPKR
jgi:hypothetical protein